MLLFLAYTLDVAVAIAMPTELPSILQGCDSGTVQWISPSAGTARLRPAAPPGRIKKRSVLEIMRENPGNSFLASFLPVLVIVLNVITA